MPRVLSPTGGRDVANPQSAIVGLCDDRERVALRFVDGVTGGAAELRMTPQMARHMAYLFILAASDANGRLTSWDDFGFNVADMPAVDR
jgi:hypothetical protein